MDATNDVSFEELDGEHRDSGPGWAEIRGVGQDSKYQPHVYANVLLKEALRNLPKAKGAGPFEVRTYVYVGYTNPGWWDGFRVQVTPGSG